MDIDAAMQALLDFSQDQTREKAERLADLVGAKLEPLALLDTEVEQIIFFSSQADDGEVFHPVKFARIIAVLEKQKVPLLLDEEGERFSHQMGAEAVYYPTEEGKSGFFAFPPNPTRTQVIEELLHYGQHRKVHFKTLSWPEIVQFELEAQQKLLAIGARLNWSDIELMQIIRAMRQWQQEHDKLREKGNANQS
jgi:hypothetical protein